MSLQRHAGKAPCCVADNPVIRKVAAERQNIAAAEQCRIAHMRFGVSGHPLKSHIWVEQIQSIRVYGLACGAVVFTVETVSKSIKQFELETAQDLLQITIAVQSYDGLLVRLIEL